MKREGNGKKWGKGSGNKKKEKEKKEEKFGEKLVSLVGKRVRAGPSTPVPAWRLAQQQVTKGLQHNTQPSSSSSSTTANTSSTTKAATPTALTITVSARKLAATLWEFHHYNYYLPLSAKMHRGGSGSGHPPPRLRHLHRDKALDFHSFFADPSTSSPDQPASASSLRRHVAASLMQHHRSMERNNRALQPVSPASYGSSMEMAPYNPAVTPNSSLDFRGRIGESGYSLKTSTELLKVLNRIWSLEEQHAANISLIKALNLELGHARTRIKELLRDQQADRREIDDLMKQIAEDKLVRKSKEQDRVGAAVQSVKDELEDERKLRKRSETLHRKLARELFEVKTAFSSALKELERERKSRVLLEDLCDEFARGINDYEQEVHALKQKPEKDWANRADHDRLILHISESWLDERLQMKLRESQSGVAEKNLVVDKLSSEIETFLQAKRKDTSKNTDNLLPRDSSDGRLRRTSLESVPLKEVLSAPQDVGDEDSEGSDSHCFELDKPSKDNFKPHGDEAAECPTEETAKSNNAMKKLVMQERIKCRNPSSLQVKFEEQMAWAMSCNGNKTQAVDTELGKAGEGNSVEKKISQKSENFEDTEEGSYGRRNKHDGTQGSSSNYMIDNLIRSQFLLSEGGNMHIENEYGEPSRGTSAWRSQASPVRQWVSRLTSTDHDICESSSKLPPSLKENTLKAKLLEARSKGHRSRLKASRGSS